MVTTGPRSREADPPAVGPVLVTGGASGIGHAVADAFARRGSRVASADVRAPEKPLAGVAFREADVTRAADVRDLFEWVRREVGAPAVLVSCAGVGIHERLAEGDPEKWARVLDVNVMGALRAVRAFVPGMLEAGRGDVVFVTSVAARRPYAWGGVYSASKAALEAAAEALRLEVQPSVRVTTVAPGVVDTPFFQNAIGDPGEPESIGWGAIRPEEVANAVVHAVTRPIGVSVSTITIRPSGQPL